MNRSVKTILITLIAFGIYFVLDDMYFRDLRFWLYDIVFQLGVSHILAYLIIGIPIFVGAYVIHRNFKFKHQFGLDQSIKTGAGFALLCTLPMFIGYALVFDFTPDFSADNILITVIAAAFFEELYFRGFLFGQIYRYTRWGFIPSVLIGAVLFGLVHLYQAQSFGESAGIFLITFAGGILYAWAFVEWNNNLWVPIFLHLFMNLSWGMFSAGDNAMGGFYSNLFRAITIALIIILTIRRKKSKNLELEVNKHTIWMKSRK